VGTFESDFIVLDGATGRVIEVIAGPAANEPPGDGSVGSWPEARGWSDAAVGAGGDTLYIFGGLAGDGRGYPVHLRRAGRGRCNSEEIGRSLGVQGGSGR